MSLKSILESVKSHVSYHSETIVAIPAAIIGLILISEITNFLIGRPSTEDVQMIAKFAIRGVGFLIAAGASIAIKSRALGDIDQNSVSFSKYLVDCLSTWIILLLALLAVFGSSLWL
jgi:hypothetical protein